MDEPDDVPDDVPDDDHPSGPLLPPDDRVWRHPSEMGGRAAEPTLPPMPLRPGAPVAVAEPFGHDHAERRHAWTVPLLSGIIGSVLTFGMVAATGGLNTERPVEREIVVRETQVPQFSLAQEPPEGSVVRIADAVSPAIVRIDIAGEEAAGSGSGVLFRDNGYIMTNAHVVDGARAITVTLAGGEQLAGEVIGVDTRTDIAVVKIDGDEPFPTALLGTASELKVGHRAVAIGSPLGLDGGPSVTAGVISALGRRVDSPGSDPLLDMIQTDAPIAPGSSGGALVDGYGAVIGITTAIAVSDVGAEGLGFATPIDIARSVAEDIIAHGRARHAWLGVMGSDLDAVPDNELGVTGGAEVTRVYDGSPAHAAGLREGDIVVGVGTEQIDSMSELVVVLRRRRPGDVVSLRILRDGALVSVSIALAELPDDLPELSEEPE